MHSHLSFSSSFQRLFFLKFHLFSFSFLLFLLPPLLCFPWRHHLSASGYSFSQYYLYLPFCLASGEHADTQRNCKPWHEIVWKKKKKKRSGAPQWEKASSSGLPKAIRLVSTALPTSDKCIVNFFRGAEWLKLWRCVNVARTDSLNDRGPCVVPTNHFRQQWKCY